MSLRKAAKAMIKDLEQRAELEIHKPGYIGDGVPVVACGEGVYDNLCAALAEDSEPIKDLGHIEFNDGLDDESEPVKQPCSETCRNFDTANGEHADRCGEKL